MNKLSLSQLISLLQYESAVKIKYPDIIKRKISASLILIMVDIAVIAISFIISFYLNDFLGFHQNISIQEYMLSVAPFAAIFLLLAGYEGLYPGFGIKMREENKKLLFIIILNTGLIALNIFLMKNYLTLSYSELFISSFILMLLLPSARICVRNVLSKFSFWGIPIIILMRENDATQMIEYLNNNSRLGLIPYIIVSTIDTKIREVRGIPVIEGIDVLSRLSGELHIDYAVVMYDITPSDEHYDETLVYFQFFRKIFLYSEYIKKPIMEDMKLNTFKIVSSM